MMKNVNFKNVLYCLKLKMNVAKSIFVILVMIVIIVVFNACATNNNVVVNADSTIDEEQSIAVGGEQSSGLFSPYGARSLKPNSITDVDIAGETFIYNDYGLFKNSKIYLLKNQSEGQIMSVVVENKNSELVIFDGGRIADAEFLVNFINEKGGVVDYWFITHIHDDHLGALYEICDKFYYDIKIKNICYNFPPFNWFYERVGNDAGSMLVFEDGVEKYKNYHNEEKSDFKVNVYYSIQKNDLFEIDDIKIKIMNNKYLIDDDCINNSSVVYKVYIEDKTMIVLGDLAYEGSIAFEKEYQNNIELKTDIVVMSHHGQSGADKSLYEKISPAYALWPTTDKIYNNSNDKYKTNEVKKWMEDIGAVNITTIEYNQILQ